MPWIFSSSLEPPLTQNEKEQIADGRSVTRQYPDGVVVVAPRSIVASYGRVTGLGITYGPNGEDGFFHKGGRLVNQSMSTLPTRAG